MRQALPFTKAVAVADSLRAAYDTEAGKYKPGWSDERVAADQGVSSPSVSERRRQLFGNFKRGERSTPVTAAERLERLERQFSTLVSRLEEKHL